ncbi:sodium:proton antiporter [Nostocaceae cyanobacterium CENA357]|uniref:Sodium:proton antiporter n=1 Tax=Atlanticothrix silvestris CENA357 TaxID=1725252 RepID=A0A8J7HN55_9CYAN|nr:sodium:proton antiporter [Atlanticothrix silvestris]MBH8555355.1 sodium:proton antiporter [Atlanticothrix silvestris CENA357]
MVDVYIIDLFVIGLLLLAVTLGSGWISRLPLSFAIIYLVVGIFLGPYGFGLIQLRQDEVFNAELLERLTEFVVIISVFSCGLKITRPLRLDAWNITARLIVFLMPISIFALAVVGKLFLGMSWGEAILLGAVLAPTDPVLASEVQLIDTNDQDELRFGLTSEGGLNDALAFPFVYFGIYALKDNDWGNWLTYWITVDLIWAIAAGIIMGIVVPKTIVLIDQKIQKHRSADALMEDFVAISIILITYSLTEVVNGYGFLAVFVAGLVVQRSYRNSEKPLAQLEFIERLEKLLEVGTILLLGSILLFEPMLKFATQSLLVAISLFLIIRPLGVWISTISKRPLDSYRRKLHPIARLLFGWFGIRGVGSLYYLAYAFGHGLEGAAAEKIAWITYTTIIISVVLHGITATPLMKLYERKISSKKKAANSAIADELE